MDPLERFVVGDKLKHKTNNAVNELVDPERRKRLHVSVGAADVFQRTISSAGESPAKRRTMSYQAHRPDKHDLKMGKRVDEVSLPMRT